MYTFEPFKFIRYMVHSDERPKARSGHRIVCDEKNLYCYGGFNPNINADDPDMVEDEVWTSSKPLFKEIWKFNFASQLWKRLPCQLTMPNELASNAVVLKGSTLIVHGGTGVPFGRNCNNKVYFCDVKDGAMSIVPSKGHLPDPQYGQAVICHGCYLYTVGGTTGYEYTCDIHRFNLITQVWESVYICAGKDQCEPKGRYRHELAFDGVNIYVLGGGTAVEAFGFEEIPTFNIETNRWSTLTTHGDVNYKGVPAPRRCHGLVQYNDEKTGETYVVISGGYNGIQIFNDIWRLNLNLLQWSCLQRCVLPRPTYFHSATLTPYGSMYTFGGIMKSGNEVFRTDAVYSVWLTIPKLSEMCWEALKFYKPNLRVYPRRSLRNMGIPLNFIDRSRSRGLEAGGPTRLVESQSDIIDSKSTLDMGEV